MDKVYESFLNEIRTTKKVINESLDASRKIITVKKDSELYNKVNEALYYMTHEEETDRVIDKFDFIILFAKLSKDSKKKIHITIKSDAYAYDDDFAKIILEKIFIDEPNIIEDIVKAFFNK